MIGSVRAGFVRRSVSVCWMLGRGKAFCLVSKDAVKQSGHNAAACLCPWDDLLDRKLI